LKFLSFPIALLYVSTGVAQSPTIIRVPVRVIAVPTVVASADGRLVRGLEADDFRLTDNDRTQALQLDYADEPSAGDDSHTLDAVASAAKQLKQVSAERRRVILLIAQSGDTGSASSLREVLRELEVNNIAVYSLVMPRVGKDLVEKTISVKDAKSAFHTNDVGFVASMDLAKLIPEIYRAEKTAAGQDDLTVLTSETGGRRIPFRGLSELEAGISPIGEELYTEYVLGYTPDRYMPGYYVLESDVGE
jgi:hypothetical protein